MDQRSLDSRESRRATGSEITPGGLWIGLGGVWGFGCREVG